MSMLTVEECELLTDSKYRSYITQVEKALRSFEYTSEWADLISALGKLNKVLLSHLKYPVIPKKVTIGKRLAQCLHPALPSGVHLKALECYDIIFKCIGTQRLAHDLFIYSAGLFPLLGHSAMSVKPVLLTVYERHFVALGRHIKPGLNGLLLGLLPGLEEGSEYFERTNLLLEDFSTAVGPPFFYTGIWECMLSCPSVRLCGATFLLSHLDKKRSMEDQLHMVGLDIDLMVSSLCSALQDTSVLVQRSMLDFLLQAFPMHSGQLTKADLSRVGEAALNVVLRRDMSLNRRLYAWLLGTPATTAAPVSASAGGRSTRDLQRADSSSTTSEMDLSYFQTHSRDLLVSALKSKLQEEDNPHSPSPDGVPTVLKPFRILISLLDKPEIGPVILESILLSVFRRLKHESDAFLRQSGQKEEEQEDSGRSKVATAESKLPTETLKTANLLFGSFEPYFIWDFIARIFTYTCEQRIKLGDLGVEGKSNDVSLSELCTLVEFVLDIIALDVYPETTTEHLPELLNQVISALTSVCDKLSEHEMNAALRLCSRLLARVQPSMAGQGGSMLDRSLSMDSASIFGGISDPMTETSSISRLSEETKDFKNSDKNSSDVNGDSRSKSVPETQLTNSTAEKSQTRCNGESSHTEPGGEQEASSTKPGLARSTSTQRALMGHLSLMQLCVQGFQQFFHTFTELHILPSENFAQDCMESIGLAGKYSKKAIPKFSSSLSSVSSSSSLQNVKTTYSQTEKNGGGLEEKDSSGKQSSKLDANELQRAYRQACRLLVDFASFPVYCLDYETILEQMGTKEESSCLPHWLQDLLVCSCFVDCFEIQASSISTVLDLIILTQTAQTERENMTRHMHHSGQRSSMSEGRISVVILPSLLPSHLVYINQRTTFYQIVAKELWAQLSEVTASRHQRAVELFHTLHQVTPTASVCEDVIGHDLICEVENERSLAFQKFSILWHLTRSIKTEANPSREPRTFDRSMFVVLDSLKEESSITKTLAVTWLTHVIQRGDTSRVLQPLLLMLLHPDTARISIQHVSVHKPRQVSLSSENGDEEDVEAKIYAISSEGGNVIYHLSQPGTTGSRLRSKQAGAKDRKRPSSDEFQQQALAMMTNTKSGGVASSTAPPRTHSVTDLSFERVNPRDVSLRINPFGSANSLDKLIFYDSWDVPQSTSMPNLEGVRRLDAQTCRAEGIFFDGSEIVEDHFSRDEDPGPGISNERLGFQGQDQGTTENAKKVPASSETKEQNNTVKISENKGLSNDNAKDSKPIPSMNSNEKAVDNVSKGEIGIHNTNLASQPIITVVTHPTPTETEKCIVESNKDIGDDSVSEKSQESSKTISREMSTEEVVQNVLEELVSTVVCSDAEKTDFPDIEDKKEVCENGKQMKGAMDYEDEDSSDSDDDDNSIGVDNINLLTSSATELMLQSEQHRAVKDVSNSNNIFASSSTDSLLNSRGRRNRSTGHDDDDVDSENDEDTETIESSSSNNVMLVDHRNLDPNTDIHELHLHMLLYSQQYDFRRTLYALSTLRAMLHSCPRLVVTAMATTSISAVKPPYLGKLQALLGRHRKSVFGKNFFGELPPEVMASYRSNMFVEIVISLCLYFVRGYYPNLMVHKLSMEELLGNKMVHILGVEILTLLMSELLSIMKESGKSFVSYISDLLSRCKLQKSLLHCLLASVYNMGRLSSSKSSTATGKAQKPQDGTTAKDVIQTPPTKAEATLKLTEMIIDFNENRLDPSVNDTFQMRLLQLVLVTIMLEERIQHAQGNSDSGPTGGNDRPHITSSLLNAHYNPSQPVVQQEMFLSAVWSALKQQHQAHLHRHWVGLVTSALPYMGRALPRIVLCIVLQLCRNLELMASDLANKRSSMKRVPPDHMVTMLEGLTTVCHYCLLDNSSPVSIGQPAPTSPHVSTETASAGQILTNLIHVFNPTNAGKEPSPARDSAPVQPVLDARARVLSVLPRVMACMATLWKVVDLTTHVKGHPNVGDFKLVRHHILELLSPISLPHGTHLLAAFAVAWNDRRPKKSNSKQSSTVYGQAWTCEDQLLLVELVSAIKVLPTDTLIQTVKQVVKQPPQTELAKKGFPLEVSLLQLFLAYIQHSTTSSQLVDSWPSLLTLLRDCLQMNLSPPALFLLLQILHEFVHKAPALEEKRQQKELQEVCQKALESVSSIAGSSLEQTTWLRKNFAVKPGPQIEGGEETEVQEERAPVPETSSTKAPTVRRSQASDSKYSVQALSVLAEFTAPMLDVIYSSEEKEKVAPFLTTLLYNVFPYLRHHSAHNIPSYRVCSQLLSSISSYQYTRRAWRREACDLLMESNFFQMDERSISYWRSIIDNLMTHDKTTFKDLMGKVSMNQTGSLSLFSSKEQEYEQRAQLMKRLAFTLFCSEADQYQRAMPDIQERLAECLRLPQVANVMTSVFLCFRVLILRMSPQHLTSLWPTIITEMVQVLLQIEQELSTETDEFKEYLRTRSRTQLQRIAALDSSWAHLGNGLNAHNNPAWLQLYLAVCKLLDMCLVMPAEHVPQFQLYRWAFVGTAGEEDYEAFPASDDLEAQHRPNPLFTPHIIRLARLLNLRLKKCPTPLPTESGRPLLSQSRLRSLTELQPFFHTLVVSHTATPAAAPTPPLAASRRRTGSGGSGTGSDATKNKRSGVEQQQSPASMTNRQYIEHLVQADFLEAFS